MEEKRKIKIYDSSFLPRTKSASIGGDNLGVGPTHFEWTMEGEATRPLFFTDVYIEASSMIAPLDRNVCWLLEPRHLRPENYDNAHRYKDFFGYILSYDAEFLSEHRDDDRFRFYPYGGSWIDFKKWGVHEKTKDISIIISDKNTTRGHQLRHEVVNRYGDRIDVYGRGTDHPVESKFEALAPYRYSIVIESGRSNYYFTEKLIDCLSVGTIPIYWGCPDIYQFFSDQSIFQWETMNHLWLILDALGFHQEHSQSMKIMYDSLLPEIASNYATAMDYAITEDWLWKNQQEIFV